MPSAEAGARTPDAAATLRNTLILMHLWLPSSVAKSGSEEQQVNQFGSAVRFCKQSAENT